MNHTVVGTSNQPGNHSSDLRVKIISILSDTANGCISELGYYPSLLKKLRELDQVNKQWREENVKLFQDNRALAQYSRRQEEHLKTVATTAPDSATKIALLEEQIKALSIQNIELKKVQEALLAGSSTNCRDPTHQRLLVDHQQLISLYQTAMREIHHLRQMVQPNAVSSDNAPFSKLSHASPSQDLQQRAPTGQRAPHGYPLLHTPSIHTGAQQQVAVRQNATQPTTSPMPHLRVDRGPGLLPSQIVTAMPDTSRGVPLQTLPTSLVNPAHFPMTRRRDSAKSLSPTVPVTYPQSVFAIQTPASSVPQGTSNSPQDPWINNVQYSYDGTGLGVLSPGSSHPNLMATSQCLSVPSSRSLPTPPVANKPFSPSAQDTSTSYTSPTCSVPSELLSPSDSASIKTPISSIQEALLTELASSPFMVSDQLKREREDIGGDPPDVELAKKKIRLGEDGAADMLQVQDANMDDESEQEIEVDPDGFRSIASCISELVENSAEDPECYICRLCDIRYKTGVISDAPKPLSGATQEQLVQHFTTEHADAWETLRGDV